MNEDYIFFPEMKNAPFERMEAYCISSACAMGMNGNFSWGTRDGIPYIKKKRSS
jgi:hypothetical protein